ncbi:predicted protein [Uncinocarpus reesii 1704]|uniref:Uncharacterized protein n=1 Tax=Uncinocarpus reesii (strain UAMH 1704) TaxID=336963 RepID=C4JDE0_UNCRE|nr:uncharacterized protein UREG_00306 [Uncinocarpus reesii 1704]EEP75460.1 predicted protein [Uncinocarpus reesii 1704]
MCIIDRLRGELRTDGQNSPLRLFKTGHHSMDDHDAARVNVSSSDSSEFSYGNLSRPATKVCRCRRQLHKYPGSLQKTVGLFRAP